VSGLLRPGVTLAQAQAELSGIQAQIDKQFPDSKHGVGVHWLNQAYFGDLRSLMNILLAAVGFILLIACVNLANMQLALPVLWPNSRLSGQNRIFWGLLPNSGGPPATREDVQNDL
jgi:hypothetical protein